MDDLKRRVKELVPSSRHEELEDVFNSWISDLKVQTIPAVEEKVEETKETEETTSEGENVPLKEQIEKLKEQVKTFKEKMEEYENKDSPISQEALAEVKEEVGRIKEDISKLRLNFFFNKDENRGKENKNLIRKLDEVKYFLERLK